MLARESPTPQSAIRSGAEAVPSLGRPYPVRGAPQPRDGSPRMNSKTRKRILRTPNSKVRYAVVGLGWIAQSAVLPGFAHARGNSELAALVSDDPVKLRRLGRKYGVTRLVDYAGFDALLASGEIDAVYLALPNHLHQPYTLRAAASGVHVLCEKPMALDEEECEDMIRACDRFDVRLMVAYRL